jgi:multiple sugar transport system ATP-binding protein
MAFSLRLKNVPNDIVYQKVTEAAEILGITEYLTRKPRALSGGQRQRVAIGRAMVRDSKVFLMDEPLSNLDAKLRNQMRAEIILLRQKIDTTFIYVTHDQTEAMTMGSRIVVMKDGYIQQVESPQMLYEKPVNMFVAGFIGSPQMNFAVARVEKEGNDVRLRMGRWTVKLPEKKAKVLEEYGYIEKEVVLGVRPEHVHDEPVYIEQFSDCVVESAIDVVELLGSESLIYFTLEGTNFISRVKPRHNLYVGDTMKFAINPEKVHIFDKETENIIVN